MSHPNHAPAQSRSMPFRDKGKVGSERGDGHGGDAPAQPMTSSMDDWPTVGGMSPSAEVPPNIEIKPQEEVAPKAAVMDAKDRRRAKMLAKKASKESFAWMSNYQQQMAHQSHVAMMKHQAAMMGRIPMGGMVPMGGMMYPPHAPVPFGVMMPEMGASMQFGAPPSQGYGPVGEGMGGQSQYFTTTGWKDEVVAKLSDERGAEEALSNVHTGLTLQCVEDKGWAATGGGKGGGGASKMDLGFAPPGSERALSKVVRLINPGPNPCTIVDLAVIPTNTSFRWTVDGGTWKTPHVLRPLSSLDICVLFHPPPLPGEYNQWLLLTVEKMRAGGALSFTSSNVVVSLCASAR